MRFFLLWLVGLGVCGLVPSTHAFFPPSLRSWLRDNYCQSRTAGLWHRTNDINQCRECESTLVNESCVTSNLWGRIVDTYENQARYSCENGDARSTNITYPVTFRNYLDLDDVINEVHQHISINKKVSDIISPNGQVSCEQLYNMDYSTIMQNANLLFYPNPNTGTWGKVLCTNMNDMVNADSWLLFKLDPLFDNLWCTQPPKQIETYTCREIYPDICQDSEEKGKRLFSIHFENSDDCSKCSGSWNLTTEQYNSSCLTLLNSTYGSFIRVRDSQKQLLPADLTNGTSCANAGNRVIFVSENQVVFSDNSPFFLDSPMNNFLKFAVHTNCNPEGALSDLYVDDSYFNESHYSCVNTHFVYDFQDMFQHLHLPVGDNSHICQHSIDKVCTGSTTISTTTTTTTTTTTNTTAEESLDTGQLAAGFIVAIALGLGVGALVIWEAVRRVGYTYTSLRSVQSKAAWRIA